MKLSKSHHKQRFYLTCSCSIGNHSNWSWSCTGLVHASLGCPDWLSCYGLLTSPSTPDEITLLTQNFPSLEISAKKAG